MNVKDFQDVEVPEGDMLSGIFKAQAALLDKYREIEFRRGALVVGPEMFGNIDHRFVQWRIKDLMQRTIEEMMEAANTLKNKQWKVSEVPTDATHFYEEIGDALHFFIEMCITAGMTSKDLARIYHQKHAVNEFRQRSQY